MTFDTPGALGWSFRAIPARDGTGPKASVFLAQYRIEDGPWRTVADEKKRPLEYPSRVAAEKAAEVIARATHAKSDKRK